MENKYVKVPLQRGFTAKFEKLFKTIDGLGGNIIGGYARYCASPRSKIEKPGDIDVYPNNETAYNDLLDYFTSTGLVVKDQNDVAITYEKHTNTPLPVQLIKPVREGKIITYGSIEEILDNFDFTIVKAAVISATECLVHKDFIEHEKRKHLVLTNIHCPISSMFRCMKYYNKYGYWLKPVEAIKLFKNWDERTQDYRDKLITFCEQADHYNESDPTTHTLSEEEIMEFERMMMLD